MKAIAPDTLGMKLMRNSIMVGDSIMRAVKCGVEAGNLWQRREIRQQRTDRRQIVGLVQRRQGTNRSRRDTTPWSIRTGRE